LKGSLLDHRTHWVNVNEPDALSDLQICVPGAGSENAPDATLLAVRSSGPGEHAINRGRKSMKGATGSHHQGPTTSAASPMANTSLCKAPPPAEMVVHSPAVFMVGNSPAMLEVFEQIRRFAACEVPVLITGESGTEGTGCASHPRSLRTNWGPLRSAQLRRGTGNLNRLGAFRIRKGRVYGCYCAQTRAY